MFCSACFVDNEEGLERCASCGEVLLPPLDAGAPPVRESAEPAPGPEPEPVEAPPETPPVPTPAEEPPSGRPVFGTPATAPGPPPVAAPVGGEARRAAADADDRRTHPRLEIPVNVHLRQPATDERERREERTIAENISRGGIRVMTTWTDLAEGEQVLVSEIGGDFESRAEVRGAFTGDDHIPRLNLKFLDREAPDRLVGTIPPAPRSGVPAGPASSWSVAAAAAAARSGPDDGGASVDEIADRQALRDEVLATYQALGKISHYELLGVPREADPGAIRSAYAGRARRFHPDRATRNLGDLRAAFEAILVKLGEARDILLDPGQRSYYDARLPRERPTAPKPAPVQPPRARPPAPQAPPPKPPPAKPPPPEPPPAKAPPPKAPPAGDVGSEPANAEADVMRAEQAIAKARKLYDSGKYWDAIQLLDSHLPHVRSENLRIRMRVMWARATAKNPRWLRRAEEALVEITRDHPRHVEAHFELGQIYSAGGLTTRAQRMYRRVLELDPSHQGAAAALNSLLTTRKL